MQLIENVLDRYSFSSLQSYVLGEDFYWFYNPKLTDPNDPTPDPGLTRKIFDAERGLRDDAVLPITLPILNICSERSDVKVLNLLQVRLFMNIPGVNNKRVVHKDLKHPHQVCLFYLTSCSEDEPETHTEFYDEDGNLFHKIVPKQNCAAVFDGSIAHSAGCAGGAERAVINFNFVEDISYAPNNR